MADVDIDYRDRLGPLLEPWHQRGIRSRASARNSTRRKPLSEACGGAADGRQTWADKFVKTVSLVEKDGVLLWCDDVPVLRDAEPNLRIGRRRRRFLRRPDSPCRK